MAKFTSFQSILALAVASLNVGALVNGQPILPGLPSACARTYTVESGDFCDEISAAQNVSTYQLATVNSAIINPTCSNLFVGEVLCLGLVGQDCDTVAVVQFENACIDIADNANITTAQLLANNPNINADCTNIYPGEVLCVAPAAAGSA